MLGRSSRLAPNNQSTKFYHGIICYNCDEEGHYSDYCPHSARADRRRTPLGNRPMNLGNQGPTPVTANAALLDRGSYTMDYGPASPPLAYGITAPDQDGSYVDHPDHNPVSCVLPMTQDIRSSLRSSPTLEDEYLVAAANARTRAGIRKQGVTARTQERRRERGAEQRNVRIQEQWNEERGNNKENEEPDRMDDS